MRDPVKEQKRLDLVQELASTLWRAAVQQKGPIEQIVFVVADEADANARELLKVLGVTADVYPDGDMHLQALAFDRDVVVRAVETLEGAEDLAEALKQGTPMKLSCLVIAYGGHSVCGLRRGVGLA